MGPPVRAVSDLPDICQLHILSLLEKSEQPLKSAEFLNKGEKGPATGLITRPEASFVQEAEASKGFSQLSHDKSPLVDAVDALARNGYALLQGAVSNELVSHSPPLVLIAVRRIDPDVSKPDALTALWRTFAMLQAVWQTSTGYFPIHLTCSELKRTTFTFKLESEPCLRWFVN